MHAVISFMRAFPQTRATICTEPVLAWLADHGVAHPFSSRIQRRLWKQAGFMNGVTEIAARIGYVLELPRDVAPGEPIVFRAPSGLMLCGLSGPDGVAVAASAGGVLISPARVFRVARPE